MQRGDSRNSALRRDRWEVYSKTAAVAVAAYVADWVLEGQLRPAFHDRVFCWAAASALVQITAILFLSLALIVLRTYARLRESLDDQLRPAIRDRVLALALEGERWSSSIPRSGPVRQVLEESIAHALATVKDAGRERLARFATEHGFSAQWVKAFSSARKSQRKRAVALLGLISPVAGKTILPAALADTHPAVRAQAYRALLVQGDGVSVDQVFRSVLGESLLIRALLVDDLKRHARYLSANTIPSVLAGATNAEAARCFELLLAWKRAMPSFDVKPWLAADRDRSLSPLLLALLPYVWTDDSVEDYVRSALESENLEIRCAAAAAAGGLRLVRLLPRLQVALPCNKRFALASATAMAQMGEAGERSLEAAVIGADRNAAAVAVEALERLTVRSL